MSRFLLLPLLLAGCASAPIALPPPDMGVRPVVASDNLDGRWTIMAVDGQAVQVMTLTLSGRSVQADLACNGGSGTVFRNGDKLAIGAIGMTERGCEPARMALDERVAAILREPLTMEFTPPARLRLVNAVGTLDLVRYQGVG